ncbi:hypothetical protein PsorP6_013445 [Peronosclerospora sorghi]|uniref:Uncharacterized protein n=1 Tax=Peronosclerospora sorghi TaxID=230839 RepID=A0ACC0VI79_9STRA|nr:hypothetical protein PsorP6_013445 [Peronosclerospora sorghi]
MASRYARKSTGLRAAKRWLVDEMETLEAVAATRRLRPIDTVLSKQKLHVLGEFFPSVAMDVRRDVLVAANYREDVAAAMLSDLTRESFASSNHTQSSTDLFFVDEHTDDDTPSDLGDEEDWSEVAGSSNSTEAWVLIQDDWEMVHRDGENVRTYADVLQMASTTEPTVSVTSGQPGPALASRASIREHPPIPLIKWNNVSKKTESDLAGAVKSGSTM